MNELQKLAILCFITSIICIMVGIVNMMRNDYFDFVFFIVLSIIGFILSLYSYKKGVKKGEKKDEDKTRKNNI